MEEVRDSKEYSWKWVTAAEILSKSACDLLYVMVLPANQTCSVDIYDGENTNGTPIATLNSVYVLLCHLQPKEPIYCRRGLYIDTLTGCHGVFVQWRVRSSKEG